MTNNAILFIDEIHRFNKSQQDSLLKALEEGVITLIGATTENPFHSVNHAIRSRCGQIKQLKPLDQQAIIQLLKRALKDDEKGLGELNVQIDESLLASIAETTGDGRTALSLLEDIVLLQMRLKKALSLPKRQLSIVLRIKVFLMIIKVIFTTTYCQAFKRVFVVVMLMQRSII